MFTSDSDFFREDLHLSTFEFLGVLYGICRFVEDEGLKSQAIAFVKDNSPVKPSYDFIVN